jgi:hypothetical protein
MPWAGAERDGRDPEFRACERHQNGRRGELHQVVVVKLSPPGGALLVLHRARVQPDRPAARARAERVRDHLGGELAGRVDPQPGRGGQPARVPRRRRRPGQEAFQAVVGRVGPAGSPRWSTTRRCRSSTAPGRRRGPGISLAGAGETSAGCSRTPTRGRWVRTTCLLRADAQPSGGLLVAGELPGAPVIGELIRRRGSVLIVR